MLPPGCPSFPNRAITNICASCRAQNDADQEFFVHWSRHLLASIQQITGCELLNGASAVTYNPHFPHFSSPYSPDVRLGATADWPQVPALLIIDAFTRLHGSPHHRRLRACMLSYQKRVWWYAEWHVGKQLNGMLSRCGTPRSSGDSTPPQDCRSLTQKYSQR
jgi:hypothetical protein